jgi:rRNA maturation protein Nop10
LDEFKGVVQWVPPLIGRLVFGNLAFGNLVFGNLVFGNWTGDWPIREFAGIALNRSPRHGGQPRRSYQRQQGCRQCGQSTPGAAPRPDSVENRHNRYPVQSLKFIEQLIRKRD